MSKKGAYNRVLRAYEPRIGDKMVTEPKTEQQFVEYMLKTYGPDLFHDDGQPRVVIDISMMSRLWRVAYLFGEKSGLEYARGLYNAKTED